MPEKQFKSSFIPKDTGRKPAKKKNVKGGNIITAIVYLVFVLAVVASIGVFAYKTILTRSLESKQNRLAEVEEAFDRDLIDSLVRLDQRLSAAEFLLNRHTALTPLFSQIEDDTTHAVRFSSFSFNSLLGQTESPGISLTGEARDFGAVAYQSQVFGQDRDFRDVIFSDLAVTERDTVTFRFDSNLTSEILNYRQSILGNE